MCKQTIGETELTRKTQKIMIEEGTFDAEKEDFFDTMAFIRKKQELREIYLPQYIKWTDPSVEGG